jgi:hypothetical protein
MYICTSPELGNIDLTQIDTTPPGPYNLTGTMGRANNCWPGMIVRAYDPMLRSGGEFIYASVPTTTAIASGTWVELTWSFSSGKITTTAQAWAGGASSGKTLAIAYQAFASSTPVQYGWFQISGIAFSVAAKTGTWAAGCTVAYNSSGTPQMTPVATKNVLNAQGLCAATGSIQVGEGTATGRAFSPTETVNYTLADSQVLVFINRPCVCTGTAG